MSVTLYSFWHHDGVDAKQEEADAYQLTSNANPCVKATAQNREQAVEACHLTFDSVKHRDPAYHWPRY
jgi:hypothetical protein